MATHAAAEGADRAEGQDEDLTADAIQNFERIGVHLQSITSQQVRRPPHTTQRTPSVHKTLSTYCLYKASKQATAASLSTHPTHAITNRMRTFFR